MTKAVLCCITAFAVTTPRLDAQAPAPLALTRAEAVAFALAKNPQLVVAQEQVAQARARVTQAAAMPDLDFSADWSGLTGPLQTGSSTGKDYGLGITMPFPQKLLLRGRVAGADYHNAQFAYLQLRQLTVSNTIQAYDAVLVAERHGDDFRQADSLAQDFLTKTRARFDAGVVPRIDVVKAQVSVAQAHNQLIANERDIANARSALNRLIGRTLGAGLVTLDSLLVPGPLPDLDSLVGIAAATRPEVQGLAAEARGAGANASLAQQYLLPDVSLGVSKNLVTGTPDSYTFALGFSVPLFFWNHQRGEVAEARHHVRELDAASRDLAAQVEQEVRAAWASADVAIKQAIYVRDQLLPEAREAYHIVSANYLLGGASSLDVASARADLVDAQTQYTDALGSANDALAQLEVAVGAPLSGTSDAH